MNGQLGGRDRMRIDASSHNEEQIYRGPRQGGGYPRQPVSFGDERSHRQYVVSLAIPPASQTLTMTAEGHVPEVDFDREMRRDSEGEPLSSAVSSDTYSSIFARPRYRNSARNSTLEPVPVATATRGHRTRTRTANATATTSTVQTTYTARTTITTTTPTTTTIMGDIRRIAIRIL